MEQLGLRVCFLSKYVPPMGGFKPSPPKVFFLRMMISN